MTSIPQGIRYTKFQFIKAFFYGLGLYNKCPLCGSEVFIYANDEEYCKNLKCKHNLEKI